MRRVLPLFALAVLLYSFAPALAQADKNTHLAVSSALRRTSSR